MKYELPKAQEYLRNASHERLLDQIAYLSHTLEIERRALRRARTRYRKAEKALKEVKNDSIQ